MPANRLTAAFLIFLCASPLALHAARPAPVRPNVLFIAIDDLNDYISPLANHPGVRTPNLDRLAKRSVTFANAHCASPLCNPSRASMLTGLRPDSLRVWDLHTDFRSTRPNATTIPQHKSMVGRRAVFPHARQRAGRTRRGRVG